MNWVVTLSASHRLVGLIFRSLAKRNKLSALRICRKKFSAFKFKSGHWKSIIANCAKEWNNSREIKEAGRLQLRLKVRSILNRKKKKMVKDQFTMIQPRTNSFSNYNKVQIKTFILFDFYSSIIIPLKWLGPTTVESKLGSSLLNDFFLALSIISTLWFSRGSLLFWYLKDDEYARILAHVKCSYVHSSRTIPCSKWNSIVFPKLSNVRMPSSSPSPLHGSREWIQPPLG